jgi:bacillithiol biosynthesis deacetylase BshB1
MKIIVFGIHPDDIEIGCGATVALCVRQGHDVVLVDLSDGASASNGTPEERAVEAEEAARILGVTRRVNLGLPDTAVHSEDPAQLEKVVSIIREVRPHLALVPNSDDPHPDHASGGRLVERALYFSGVHGYRSNQASWKVETSLVYAGRLEIKAHVIVDVSDTYGLKIKALQAHKTQFIPAPDRNKTPLNSPSFMKSLEARLRLHGHQIRAEYGEPFRILNPLAVTDMDIFGG